MSLLGNHPKIAAGFFSCCIGWGGTVTGALHGLCVLFFFHHSTAKRGQFISHRSRQIYATRNLAQVKVFTDFLFISKTPTGVLSISECVK